MDIVSSSPTPPTPAAPRPPVPVKATPEVATAVSLEVMPAGQLDPAPGSRPSNPAEAAQFVQAQAGASATITGAANPPAGSAREPWAWVRPNMDPPPAYTQALRQALRQGQVEVLRGLPEADRRQVLDAFLLDAEREQVPPESLKRILRYVGESRDGTFHPALVKLARQQQQPEQALSQYNRVAHHLRGGATDNLAAEIQDERSDLFELHRRLTDNPTEDPAFDPIARLSSDQRRQLSAQLRQRMLQPKFTLEDAGMMRELLSRLQPGAMDDKKWARLLGDTLQQRRQSNTVGDFFNSPGHLKELSAKLEGVDQDHLFRAVVDAVQTFPESERGKRYQVLDAIGASEERGQIVPTQQRGQGILELDGCLKTARDPAAEREQRIAAAYRILNHPGSFQSHLQGALEVMRQLGVDEAALARYAMRVGEGGMEDDSFAKAMGPTLKQPDPEGLIAGSIADQVLRNQRAFRKTPALSRDLSRYRGALHNLTRFDSPTARDAAQRVAMNLASDPELVEIDSTSAELALYHLADMQPSLAVLQAALRMRGATSDAKARARADAIVARCKSELVGQDLNSPTPAVNQSMSLLSQRYSEALERGDQEQAQALRGLLGEVMGAATGHTQIPTDMGGEALWNRDGQGYLPEFLARRRALGPDALQKLEKRLGNLPQQWGDTALGFRAGGRAAEHRQFLLSFLGGQKLSDLQAQLAKAGPADRPRIQAQIEALSAQYNLESGGVGGLGARYQAAQALGKDFALLDAYAEQHKLSPAQFDGLLMASSSLSPRLLSLPNLAPEALQLALDSASQLPPGSLEKLAGECKDGAEFSQKLAALGGARLTDYSQGGESSATLFRGSAREDSLGERMARFHLKQKGAGPLLLDGEGRTSLIDRLVMQAGTNQDARLAAQSLLEDIIQSDPEGEQARLAKVQLARLNGTAPPEPKPAQGDLGQAANAETVYLLSERLLTKWSDDVMDRQPKGAMGELVAGVQKIDEVRRHLPQPLPARLGAAEGRLESVRQQLLARHSQAQFLANEIDMRQRDHDIREQLKLKQGMDHKAVRGLIKLAANSPTDMTRIAVQAEAGVKVHIPFYGEARLFVRGEAAFEINMSETGQVQVSFTATIGVGASAEVKGMGGEVGAGTYTKITYAFANEDEAASFVVSILQQIQGKPAGPTPTPLALDETGTFLDRKFWVGPVEVSGNKRVGETRVHRPLPWLPLGQGDTVKMPSIISEMGAQINTKRGNKRLSVKAEDLKGSHNQAANGTTLTIAFESTTRVSREDFTRTADSPTDAFIDDFYETVQQMRPELLKGISPEEAKMELRKMYTGAGGKVSVSSTGKLELTLATGANLMHSGKCDNAIKVLMSMVEDVFAKKKENSWTLVNARRAKEYSAEAHVSLQYGAGVAAYVQLGLQVQRRDATTMAGSLYHARMMLYDTKPGVPISDTQLRELQKDGLLDLWGRLNEEAMLAQLAKMRREMNSLKKSECSRLRLSEADFEKNVDLSLQRIIDSMYAGLRNSGRTSDDESRFRERINLDKVRQLDEMIGSKALDSVSDSRLEEETRKLLGSAPASFKRPEAYAAPLLGG